MADDNDTVHFLASDDSSLEIWLGWLPRYGPNDSDRLFSRLWLWQPNFRDCVVTIYYNGIILYSDEAS